MEIDRDKQAQALAKAKNILADAERKREAARVEKGVENFLQGRFDILFNDEFVENLASYILDKYITDDQDAALKVLQKLGKSLCSDTVSVRERSLMVISVFTEIILEEDFKEFREVLARILVDWLKYETEYIAGFEFVCSQLQKIILRMLYDGQWFELENLIIILHQISTGVIAKSNLIRGMSAKVHENLAEPDILDKLVNVYLDENDERKAVAESLLIHLGKLSATFLVQKLIYCNNKEDRFALIDIIPKTGEISVPVLIQCLKEEPPWFVIRNIILIISRLADPGLYHVVEPYMTHRDIRVQQQVINCIEMLGGKNMRKRLIQAMMQVNDELKGQLIMQLGQFEGMDVGNGFLDLLEKHESFASHVRDDLVLKLCIKIKFYPSKRAIDCLKDLIAERRSRFGEADRLVRAAATSLQAIEIKLKEDGTSSVPPIVEQVVENELTIDEELEATDDHFPEESGDLFSDSEMEQLSTGEDLADFSAAGEEEKAGTNGTEMPFYSSQDHHLSVWSKLYEQMTTEEANEFFATLNPVSYQANDEIALQGDERSALFFIDNGFAGISHVDENTEVLLTSLQTGDMIGSEGFIRDSPWSVSLQAQTELQVRVLERDRYDSLVKLFPGLSEKLRHYCNHYDVVPYLINISDDPGREPIGDTIEVHSRSLFRSSDGDFVLDTVEGTLYHIAQGGYCFTLPYVHEENAITVLGRQVSSEIELDDGTKRRCFGVIAGAGTHDPDEQNLYLYVKFYHPFEKASYSCKNLEVM